jgi:hypothetical protein
MHVVLAKQASGIAVIIVVNLTTNVRGAYLIHIACKFKFHEAIITKGMYF